MSVSNARTSKQAQRKAAWRCSRIPMRPRYRPSGRDRVAARTRTCASRKTASSWCAAASAATARRSISAKPRYRARRCGFRPAKSVLATRSAATGEKARMIALCDAMVQSDQFADARRDKGDRAAARGDIGEAEPQGARKPRRRGSISTPWCAERADDDGCRTARRICRQGACRRNRPSAPSWTRWRVPAACSASRPSPARRRR